MILVGGEAGVGKPALLRQFCSTLDDETRVLWGSCDHCPRRDRSAAARHRPVHRRRFRELLTTDAKPYDVMGALVAELQLGGPSVVVFEDIHWADEATLDVLRLLAAARRNDPGPRVGQLPQRRVRPERPSAHRARRVGPPSGRRSSHACTAVPRRRRRTRRAPPRRRHRLYRKTRGNPFFVTEVLAGVGDIPDTVRDAVLAHAARLNPPARSLPMRPPSHRRHRAVAARRPRRQLVDHLDECFASGMLISESDGVAFRHELARWRSRTRSLRPGGSPFTGGSCARSWLRPRVHRTSPASPITLRLRRTRRQCCSSRGRSRAGRVARRPPRGCGVVRRCVRVADGEPLEVRANLFDCRSRECFLTDQSDESIEARERALECYPRHGNRVKEGESLLWLSRLRWCRGRIAECKDLLGQAVAVLEGCSDGHELAMAYSHVCPSSSTPRTSAGPSPGEHGRSTWVDASTTRRSSCTPSTASDSLHFSAMAHRGERSWSRVSGRPRMLDSRSTPGGRSSICAGRQFGIGLTTRSTTSGDRHRLLRRTWSRPTPGVRGRLRRQIRPRPWPMGRHRRRRREGPGRTASFDVAARSASSCSPR